MPLTDRPEFDSTASLLSFSIGPVQTFIASARSLRDLWTGSFVLSWLTCRAMQPIVEPEGPGLSAILIPALERDPLEYLRGSGGDRPPPACLPNWFLVEVPGDPNGRLNIVRDSGLWLSDESGHPTRAVRHICWDGCMFPNKVM